MLRLANDDGSGYSIAMRRHYRTGEFYCRASVAALAILAGCATARVRDPNTITVYLVRHGEKSTAVPNDPNPDLSTAGWARANALATKLHSAGVSAIIATQLKRTQETAEPLAAQLRLNAEVVTVGGPAHADSVAAAIRRHRGETVLVVGHSNTIAPIIAALGGPKLPNLCDSEYSSLFVVTLTGSAAPVVVRRHYGAPDPAPDSACVAMQSR